MEPLGRHTVIIGGGNGMSAVAPYLAASMVGTQDTLVVGVAMSDSGGSVPLYAESTKGRPLSDLTKAIGALGNDQAAVAAFGANSRLGANATVATVTEHNAACLATI